MVYVCIFVAAIGFLLNLDAPADLSYADKTLLVMEFVGTVALGKGIINHMIPRNMSKLRRRFFNCFLFFLFLSFLYLFFCWTPFLSPNHGAMGDRWGFDPQRYYWYALQFEITGSTDIIQNYMGVVFVYKYIMSVFGIDPLVPLLFNALMVLFALTSMSRTCMDYETTLSKRIQDYFPFLFFIPETIAYGAMTSREVISAALALLCLSYSVRYVLSKRIANVLKIFVVIILLFVIRPPFGIMAIIAFLLVAILHSARVSKLKVPIIALVVGVGIFTVGNYLNTEMGSFTDVESISDSFNDRFSGENERGEDLNYSSDSFVARLIPHTTTEFIVYGIVRTVTYLVPKGNPFTTLASGNLYNTFDFLTGLTSVLFMLFIPALWKLLGSYKRQSVLIKSSIVFFIIYLAIIGFGITTFIQDRYRIVFDFFVSFLFLYSLAEMGKSELKRYTMRFFLRCAPILITIYLFIRL